MNGGGSFSLMMKSQWRQSAIHTVEQYQKLTKCHNAPQRAGRAAGHPEPQKTPNWWRHRYLSPILITNIGDFWKSYTDVDYSVWFVWFQNHKIIQIIQKSTIVSNSPRTCSTKRLSFARKRAKIHNIFRTTLQSFATLVFNQWYRLE